jgi:rhodanese-related sulfurtransferase
VHKWPPMMQQPNRTSPADNRRASLSLTCIRRITFIVVIPLIAPINRSTFKLIAASSTHKMFYYLPRSVSFPMKHHNPRFVALVDDARTRIFECSVEDIKARIDSGERFNLIDVREESEFALARLPGARHLGKGVIERDIETFFPNLDTELVLYCGGGYRSALAADALQNMGYTNIIAMDGGFRAWKEAGFQIEM